MLLRPCLNNIFHRIYLKKISHFHYLRLLFPHRQLHNKLNQQMVLLFLWRLILVTISKYLPRRIIVKIRRMLQLLISIIIGYLWTKEILRHKISLNNLRLSTTTHITIRIYKILLNKRNITHQGKIILERRIERVLHQSLKEVLAVEIKEATEILHRMKDLKDCVLSKCNALIILQKLLILFVMYLVFQSN